MAAVSKATKTFSLDRDLLAAVKRTKGSGSKSERVLRQGLDLEKKAALDREAAEFSSAPQKDRQERRAFQKGDR